MSETDNRAVVSAQDALNWARANGVVLPKAGRVAAINAKRIELRLPPFRVMRAADDSSLDALPPLPEPAQIAAPRPFIPPPHVTPHVVREKPAPPTVVEEKPVMPAQEDQQQPALAETERVTARQPVTSLTGISKTSSDLRDLLFSEFRDLRAGTSTPARAIAAAKLAAQIVASVRMEVELATRLTTIDAAAYPRLPGDGA